MTPTLRLLPFLLLFSLLACLPQEQQEQSSHRLGEISLAVSGDSAALPAFERGLLLLHSFEYDDAATAFREAQQADPDFALAYWGEAMTHNHPLWRQQDRDSAQAILSRLGDTPEARLEKAPTALEKDLLRATHVLYGEGDKSTRDQAYVDFMGQLRERYPDNHEVRAFYALSLLGSVKDGRDEDTYGQGAIIAQGILEENPDHPGALHYLIHAYDDPGHAAQAILAADRYAEVAPDASHALHMPSHIYVALGRWADVVASNEAAWQASLDRKARLELGGNARGYHAFHWLLYGYLQQGRTEDAAQLLRDMQRYVGELPSRRARAHLVLLRSTYQVETADWQGEFADLPIDMEDLSLPLQAQQAYVEGRQAHAAGDAAALQAQIHRLDSAIAAAEWLARQEAIATCGPYQSNQPNRTDVGIAATLSLQLKALAAELKGDQAQAEKWMQAAVQREANTSYSYGPPDIVKPAPEAYGRWLLAQERPREALAQFEAALERGPRRIMALKGKADALEAMGQADAAQGVRQEVSDTQL
jgi:pentatricopeptide repeat protein